jgi:hypothetical protein
VDPVVPHHEVIDAGGRTLTIRTATLDDLDELVAMYERFDEADVHRRFFSASAPRHVIEQWLRVGERGGEVLVVVDSTGRVVGDAGYAVEPSGNGELGIAISRELRGWLGPYLLDVVVGRAAARGIPNLEAEVLSTNCAMLAMLRARGCAFVPAADVQTVRVVIATSGAAPTFPPAEVADGARRVVIERSGAHWWGASQLQSAGAHVLVCPGPGRGRTHPCPLAIGEPCPLVDAADAVLVVLGPDEVAIDPVLAAHRARRGGPPVAALASSDTAADVAAVVDQAVASARYETNEDSVDRRG